MPELPTTEIAAPLYRPYAFGEPVSERFRDPAGYQADDDLDAAVRVALLLGMPLLLTGEPGCGKTSVAGWLARRLGLGEPLVFNVKSTTAGRDLLYEFDELARFRDSQAGQGRPVTDYLRLNPLGLAILLSTSPHDRLGYHPVSHEALAQRSTMTVMPDTFGQRHVVLIDELDKAPRDTPNDLLLEILEMKFLVREADAWITGNPALRPVVIITSNSEKSLPEPFLRRCVFHHIKAPDDAMRRRIVVGRMHPFAARSQAFDWAMRLFDRLSGNLGRPPGTAELLAWLTVLEERARTLPLARPAELAAGTLGALAKTREDLDRALAALADADAP
ncbi:AAA family ATPase [Ideonella sp. BN130291]|uniref:AAA family ATPase n=1 Tax=Ideonella sp. BN130291 TaxID=3112940 RepID=UPI002E264797|nr:AAA family ATPase [Ideonella sp. BN130291]